MADEQVLIVSPVRNEAAHIERVARSLAAQTHPPSQWVVVDDGSSDGTSAILSRLAEELDFMTVVSTPPNFTGEAADRLAVAAAPRAFNYGLAAVDASAFTHIGKLDGDIELEAGYYQAILEEFDRNPSLGIAGGAILERRQGKWVRPSSAREHVRGALKLYRRDCFEAIGGIVEILGWDGIDETVARMRGYETRSFDCPRAFHHRHTGTADGRLRGHVRWGECHWILHHGVLWTILRAGKVARQRPLVLGAAAYLYGYARAALRGVPRVQIEGYHGFVQREQRRRMLGRLENRLPFGRSPAAGGG